MYINLRIKNFKLGSEDAYGKYPTLIIEFEKGSTITIPIKKAEYRKLRKLILNYDIYGNRSYYINVFKENKELRDQIKELNKELEELKQKGEIV